jgi:hypothetical protein
MEYTVTEGDNSKIDFTLTYSQYWSDSAKRGLPVPRSDVSRAYFYVSSSLTASPWLSLTDASSTQIQWLDTTNGRIRIFLNGGGGTEGHVGDNQRYELRLKMTDGTYVSAESGVLNVLDSIVETP